MEEMGRRLLVTVLTLVLFGSIIAAQASSPQLSVERTVEVSKYGLVTVKDRISGHGGSAFTVLVMPEDVEDVVSYYVSGATFNVARRGDGSLAIELRPTSEVVEVSYTLRSKVEQRSADSYALRLVDVPAIEGASYSANVTVRLPVDSSFTSAPTGYVSVENVAHKFFEELSPTGASPTFFIVKGTGLRLLRAESVVEEFDPYSGRARIELVLRNDDLNSISAVDLLIPGAGTVKVLRVGDDLGTLRYSLDRDSGVLTVYLTPERYELRQGWRYGFAVDLDVSGSGLYSLVEGSLEVRTFLPIEAQIDDFRVRVVLPEGFRLAELPDYVTQFVARGGSRVAELRAPLPMPQPGPFGVVALKLTGSPTQPWGAYALLIGVMALVLGSVMAHIRVRRASKPKIAEQDRAALSRVKETIEAMLAEVEEISRAVRSPEKSALPALRDRVQRVKRSSDAVLEELRRITYRGPEVSRMASEVQRNSSVLNESLRVLLKTYTDFARGELSRSSLEKMVAPILKDVRSSVAGIREVVMMVDELVR